jgi:hypothetical protein
MRTIHSVGALALSIFLVSLRGQTTRMVKIFQIDGNAGFYDEISG